MCPITCRSATCVSFSFRAFHLSRTLDKNEPCDLILLRRLRISSCFIPSHFTARRLDRGGGMKNASGAKDVMSRSFSTVLNNAQADIAKLVLNKNFVEFSACTIFFMTAIIATPSFLWYIFTIHLLQPVALLKTRHFFLLLPSARGKSRANSFQKKGVFQTHIFFIAKVSTCIVCM